MILIIGLGNPGGKYEKTRHNIGWMVLDFLQKKYREEYRFPEWKKVKRLKAEISKGEINNQKVILAKLLTFMNLSGQAVKLLTSYYKVKPGELIVIHDDSDLLLGVNRIAKNRGSAGHKGIESIISNLKTKNFLRFRIGFKPKDREIKNLEEYVLKKISREEKSAIRVSINKTVAALTEIANGKRVEEVMNKFNKK